MRGALKSFLDIIASHDWVLLTTSIILNVLLKYNRIHSRQVYIWEPANMNWVLNIGRRVIRIIEQGDSQGNRSEHSVHVAACNGDGNEKP